jgi:hypothetical protein
MNPHVSGRFLTRHDDAPEIRLAVTAFRCALVAFALGDTQCWETGWRALREALPPGDVGPLFGQFYGFARALLMVACRPISYWPVPCRELCDDETLALAMIAAAQRRDHAATLEAASALLGTDELGDALMAAQALAAALSKQGIFVGDPWRTDFHDPDLRAGGQRDRIGP